MVYTTKCYKTIPTSYGRRKLECRETQKDYFFLELFLREWLGQYKVTGGGRRAVHASFRKAVLNVVYTGNIMRIIKFGSAAFIFVVYFYF